MNRTAGIRPLWLVIGASLWMATVGNVALWGEMRALEALQGPAGWAFGAGLALMVAACLAAIVSLLAWRWTLKPVLIVLLIASAAATHFMLAYHVVIDSSMIVNVLQTDAHEAAALFDWRLLATLGLVGLLPAIGVWRVQVRHGGWPAQALRNLAMVAASLALAVGLALLSFQPLSSTMRNHKQVRYLINPLNTLYALGYAASKPLQRPPGVAALGTDARVPDRRGRPPLLVLVLGETTRSGNFRPERLRRGPRHLNSSVTASPAPFTPPLAAPARRHRFRACSRTWVASGFDSRRPGLRNADGRASSMPAWPCCGSTTSPDARACAIAFPTSIPPP